MTKYTVASRLCILGAVTGAALTFMAAYSVGSATATICAQVAEKGTGWHKLSDCSDAPPKANQEYILVNLASRVWITLDEYCAKVVNPTTESGEFKTSACSAAETGTEWIKVKGPLKPRMLPPPPMLKGMKIKGGTSRLYDKAETIKITCTSQEGKGEVASETTFEKVFIIYKGCTGTKSGAACSVKSEGAAAEEIDTAELTGKLGAVSSSESTSEVGIDYSAHSGSELIGLVGSCVPCPAMVTGNVVGEIPTSALFTESTGSEFLFKETSEAQNIKLFEGGEDVLSTFGSEGALESSEEITFEEPVVIV